MPGQFDPVTEFFIRNGFEPDENIWPPFVVVCLEINVRRTFHEERFFLQRTMDRETCLILQATDERCLDLQRGRAMSCAFNKLRQMKRLCQMPDAFKSPIQVRSTHDL